MKKIMACVIGTDFGSGGSPRQINEIVEIEAVPFEVGFHETVHPVGVPGVTHHINSVRARWHEFLQDVQVGDAIEIGNYVVQIVRAVV